MSRQRSEQNGNNGWLGAETGLLQAGHLKLLPSVVIVILVSVVYFQFGLFAIGLLRHGGDG